MSTASCSGPPVISVGSPGFYLLHQETWDSLITYLQMTFTASGLSFLPDQTEGIDLLRSQSAPHQMAGLLCSWKLC